MTRWSRREFTRNAAMATLFAPFVKLFVPGEAKAQAAGGRAKYLLIMMSNGTFPNVWRPGAGSGEGNINHGPMTAPLAQIAGDGLILVDGLSGNGTMAQHAQRGALSGRDDPFSPNDRVSSIDYYVANNLRARNIITQVPAIYMGGVPGIEPNNTVYDQNTRKTPITSPSTAFGTLFSGAPAPAPTNPTPGVNPNAAALSALAARGEILKALSGDIAQLRNQLVGLERAKLELHVESIEQLQNRFALQKGVLEGAPPVAGAPPNEVRPVQCNAGANPGDSAGNNRDLDNAAKMLPLAVLGFGCDLTRVAVVEFGNHQSTNIAIPNATGDWHNGFIHGEGERGRSLPLLEAWLSDRFVETVGRLKSTPAPDGNGSLYDQTIMLWGRNMGDSLNHNDMGNVRFVVAGRAGGYLRHANGGRYLNANGASHQQLLIAAGEAMGVADFSTFGKRDQSKDPLASLKA
jgi:hypothetical protein